MRIKKNEVVTVSISFAHQPALLAFIASAPRGDVARICKEALRAAAGVDTPPPKKVRKTSLRSISQNGMQLR